MQPDTALESQDMPDKFDTSPPLFDKRLAAILVIAVLAAVAPFLFVGGKSNVAWETSHEIAVAKSKEQSRPMFVYFTARWCQPCKQLKQHVFPNDGVESLLNQAFIPVMIDTTDNGPEEMRLGAIYQVDALPTMVIVHPDGQTIAYRTGTIGAQGLIDWLNQHRNQPVGATTPRIGTAR